MNRLTYYLTAKNQYNLHSPFVFDFYCNVMNPRLRDAALGKGGLPRFWKKNISLCYKLADYYGISNVVFDESMVAKDKGLSSWLSSSKNALFKMMALDKEDAFIDHKTCLFVCEPEIAEKWTSETSGKMDGGTVFAVPHIHGNPRNELLWSGVKHNAGVTLTIDVFSMGLVFFRKELSKQDFILR